MNINDFDIEVPPGDMLITIFNHQRELMNKYHPIEEKIVGHPIPSTQDMYGPHCGPLNIQDRASQLQIKSFAWRVTEEITEATVCLLEKELDERHFLEELVDALHFSVELCIMCGIDPSQINSSSSDGTLYSKQGRDILGAIFDEMDHITALPYQNNLRTRAYLVVEKLGEAMNRLKLKPWKATAILTDEKLFNTSMLKFFFYLIILLKASGFTAKSLTAMYLSKNAVNQFRIRSNY